MRKAAGLFVLIAGATIGALAGPMVPSAIERPGERNPLLLRENVSPPAPAAPTPPAHPAAPGVPPTWIINPDVHVRLAAQFVSTADDFVSPDGRTVRGHNLFRKEDLPYIRFLSWWNVRPDLLDPRRRLGNWWLQQMSFQQTAEPLKEVPGSAGRLDWIDIRDYLWNAASWQAVAERDFYIAEPWVDHEQTEFLRRKLAAPLSATALKGREIAAPGGRTVVVQIFPTGTVITGTQFLRDTMETDRVTSYYDLLFSRQRFTDVKLVSGEQTFPGDMVTKTTTRTVKKTVPAATTIPNDGYTYYHSQGAALTRLPPGTPIPSGLVYWEGKGHTLHAYTPPQGTQEVEEVETIKEQVPGPPRSVLGQARLSFKFVNFPKDETEWNAAFGIDKVQQFAKENQLDLDFGAIVEGGLDNPKQGSMVATHNRLIVTLKGPFGASMKTFDVAETTGLKDFSETLIFAGKAFKKGVGAQAIFDAGELLSYLPNGGQAGLLINAAGLRLETADNRFANDRGSTTMDVRVRNMGSCVVCHAPSGGYILPKDLLNEGWERGIDAKFKDREQRNRVKAFFLAYLEEIKGLTARYDGLLQRTTGDLSRPAGPDNKGWSGAQVASELEAFRKNYDDPVDPTLGAAELGIPVAELRRLLAKSPFNRANQMLQGRDIPRRTWEKDLYPNLQILRQAEVDEVAPK